MYVLLTVYLQLGGYNHYVVKLNYESKYIKLYIL